LAYLLDTHVLLWASLTPTKLGKRTLHILQRHPDVYYSSVSTFELTLKESLGKLNIDQSYFQRLEESGFRDLPFASSHARASSRFGALVGHDPFDQMILAQAASEQATLITADSKLLSLGLPLLHDAHL
jgi:PIN domain nuclease of toxin-antitoxin system